MEELDKIYFLPGDTVTVRQDLHHKPIMYVVRKVSRSFKLNGLKGDFFQGILCRWFTSNGQLQEAIFNTKDLIKIKES